MQRGIRLWYDDGIEAGSDFREFIAEKIRDSWQVLLFASHESIQPGFVRNEINYALHCGKPILRVNLDDVELTPGMELSLGGMQYVDATEPGGDYLERIVRTLVAERKVKAWTSHSNSAAPAQRRIRTISGWERTSPWWWTAPHRW